ncbi:MAG: hypothetical protein AAGB25_06100 [Pseudomonadota bacterium]
MQNLPGTSPEKSTDLGRALIGAVAALPIAAAAMAACVVALEYATRGSLL